MKKLYLIARNHMDPSWLRCFEDPFTHPDTGDIVRPYSDIEELQILEYMDFAERYGVKYQIEQSFVVKKFLERNPDQKDRFSILVKKGLLELAGGGETVIDCNLTQGESWARNHLYSIRYYQREFGHKPNFAITPDIFGLPSQLPQFFRSVGYDALIIFDRVLKNNKPFWRGLDGTCIVLDSCFLQPPEPNLRTADCVKLPACGACHGKGCALCSGTGVDTTYDMTRPDKELLQSAYYGNMSADVFLETLLETEKDEYFVMITTEEPCIGDYLYGPLVDAAKRHDMEVVYLGFEENHEKWCPGQEEMLRSGSYTDDQIDLRPEGNPAACGCYSSRIEIKKANRELETLLAEAESLSVLARLHGGWDKHGTPRRDYPAEKLESLWNQMAFIQFHDCITGTHTDASYHELQRYILQVRRGAYQIYQDAAKELCKAFNFDIPDGFYAAVQFNPTQDEQLNPVLQLHVPAGTGSVRIFDVQLNEIPAFDFCVSSALVGHEITCRASMAVPAFGARIFLWKPGEEKELTVIPSENTVIENEYFRITANGNTVTEVYDKRNERTVLGQDGISLAIGTDIGNPWGRAEPERDHRQLYADSIRTLSTPQYQRMILQGVFSDPELNVQRLAWSQELTLIRGEGLVRVHTALDWNGSDSRVFASFKPAFRHKQKLICEVPFGTMERDMPEMTNVLGLTDEWPSLNFVGLSDGTYNVAVLKGGFPGSRLLGDKLQISLLRAFSDNDAKYRGTNDHGIHISDYAITTWSGSFADGCCGRRAADYLRQGHTEPLTAPGKWIDPKQDKTPLQSILTLMPVFCRIPDALCVSAFKWAEDGYGPVIRLWESSGNHITLELPDGVTLQRCNTLEEPFSTEHVSAYTFRPFEIATFRIRFS